MANNENLRDEDLFYISRYDGNSQSPFGTQYQITWEHIRRRALQPGDRLLVQSNGEYYHVAIGDYWSGAKTIDEDNDFFLVERRSRDQFLLEYQGLYFVQFEIPETVMWDVIGLGASDGVANQFAFSYDITMQQSGNTPPKLMYPDGTEHTFVPGQKTRIESDLLGIYRLEGTVQLFQSVANRHKGEVDFSISSGEAWRKVTEHSTQLQKFGERMFAGCSRVTGIPAGLKVQTCKDIFRGVGNIECSVETIDTEGVTDFSGAFQGAGHAGSIGFDSWNVTEGIDFTNCFRAYKGDEVPNSWVVNKGESYQNLYTDATNIVGPVTWTGTFLNEASVRKHVVMNDMFARCRSLVGPVHIPVLTEPPPHGSESDFGWWLNRMFEDCVSMKYAPVFANHPTREPDAPENTNARYVNQAEHMFHNCHELDDRRFREWKVEIELYKCQGMFKNCRMFDADLSNWYMGGVQDVNSMFRDCKVFNSSLSTWKTGACSNYAHMFDGCEIYNQPMDEWRTRKATNMTSMFANCLEFDQDLTPWCVPKISSKPVDFDEQTAFQDEDLKQPSWGNCDPYQKSFQLVSGATAVSFHGRHTEDVYVTDPTGREYEFKASSDEFSLNLIQNGWYGVDGMEHFTSIRWSTRSSPGAGQLRFSDTFDVSNVSDFSKCFDQIGGMKDDANFGRWDVSNATNMHAMFRGCGYLYYRIPVISAPSEDWVAIQGEPNCDISAWDTSKVTDMSQMFKNGGGPPRSAGNFRLGVPTWNWNTSNVTNMYEMFMDFKEKHMPDVGSWDVRKVTNMARTMCRTTFELPAEHGDTYKPPVWGQDGVQLDRWEPIECVNFNEFFLNTTTAGENNQGGNRGTGTWRTPKAKHMVRMFKDSYATDDLRDWCVPLIKSRPDGFAYLSKTNNQWGALQGHPGWGTCDASVYHDAVIAAYGTESRNIVQVGGEVDKIRDADTIPAPTWIPEEQQWEISDSADPDGTWDEITGEVSDTLVINASMDNKYVRLRQLLLLESSVTLHYPNQWKLQDSRKPNGTLAIVDDMSGDERVWISILSQWSEPGYGEWRTYKEWVGGDQELTSVSNPVKVQPVPAGNVIVAVTWRSPSNGELFQVSGEKTTAGKIYYEDGTEYDIGPGAFSHTFTTTGVWVIESDDLTALSFSGTTAEFSLDPVISYMDSIVDASRMFEDCRFYTQSLDWWDTQYVTNMSYMFSNALNYVGDVSNWNTTNVTDMSYMFNEAYEFNGDLTAWDVSNVTNMHAMFSYTRTFNQPLSDWDVSNVGDMSEMFWSSREFNASLKEWNVLSVGNMARMFQDAKIFNQDLYFWEPDSCSNMDYMFQGATEMTEDISSWCVPLITEHPEAFATGAGFQDDIALQPEWGWCEPTPLRGEFNWYSGDQLSFRGYVVEAETVYDVTTSGQDALFHIGPGEFEVILKQRSGHPYGLYSLPVGKITKLNFKKNSANENGADFDFTNNFKTPICTDMSHFLEGHYSFTGQVDNLLTGHVTNMHRFAYGVHNINLQGGGFGDLDVKSCRDMSEFFGDARNIYGFAALKDWNTIRCENMADMFKGGKILDETVGCEGWNTSNVRNMSGMFSSTRKAGNEWDMDLGFWDTSNVNNMESMFRNSSVKCELADWSVKNVENMEYMFYGAADYDRDISTWCVPKIPSYPLNFGGKQGWPVEKRPNWGTCPPRFISPLIRIRDREEDEKYSPAAKPGLEIIEWESDGELTFPISKEIINQYWEIRESVNPEQWVTISEEEIVDESYESTEFDAGKAVRLVQELFNPFELNGYEVRSNIIEISTELPPLVGIIRFKTLNDVQSNDDYPVVMTWSNGGATEVYNSLGELLRTAEGGRERIRCGEVGKTDHDHIVDITTEYLQKINFEPGEGQRIEIDPRSDWSWMTNMSGMFDGTVMGRVYGLQNIDTSNVVDMRNLFWMAKFLSDPGNPVRNINVSSWNTSNVTNMHSMFYDAMGTNTTDSNKVRVNLLGIENWDVSNVKSMENMFEHSVEASKNDGNYCFNFNIDNWNFSSLENAKYFFGRYSDSPNRGSWHVKAFENNGSNVGSLHFRDYPNIINKPWPSLKKADIFFAGWQEYDGHIETLNAPELTDAAGMFSNCHKITVNLNRWNTPKLFEAYHMFENCFEVYGNFGGWAQNLDTRGESEYRYPPKIFFNGPLAGQEPLNNSICPGEVPQLKAWKGQLVPKRKSQANTEVISDGEVI